jgi:hypothetical protein
LCGDTIGQSSEARATCGIGSTDAIVVDPQHEMSVLFVGFDVHMGGVCVLGGVR